MNETRITVEGNLTADPELRYTQNGIPVVNITIASTPREFDKQTNEWKDKPTLFLRASAWRELAENIAGSLQKGAAVIATGDLNQRSYKDRDGNERTAIELALLNIGPSLRKATASVMRKSGGFGGGGGQPVAEEPWATPGSGGADAWSTPVATPGAGYVAPPAPATGADAWSAPGAYGDDTPF